MPSRRPRSTGPRHDGQRDDDAAGNWTAPIEAIVLGDGGPRHPATVAALLDAGADPRIAERQGTAPLALARSLGHAAIAAMIEQALQRAR